MAGTYEQFILEHYEQQATACGLAPTSTMLDATVRERETCLIERFAELAVRYLEREGGGGLAPVVCDVGCGNGFTLMRLVERWPDARFWGIEFTPSLRELAVSRFRDRPGVTIAPGDLRDLSGYDARFDLVVCQRVLINLLDTMDQRQGLATLARIVRPGGFLLSLEAFEGPLATLNAAREEFKLPPIPPAEHNRYLPEGFYASEPSLEAVRGPMLHPGLPDDFLPSNFLSSHYFIARVLHPIALGPDRPFTRNSHFVQFLTSLCDRPVGDYAPIKAFAFRKRSSRS